MTGAEDRKPPSIAVALRYDHARGAVPKVVAKGLGAVADRIVEEARGAGIAVERNEALARCLADVEIDRAIPPELYRAVAEIIGFLMRKGFTPRNAVGRGNAAAES